MILIKIKYKTHNDKIFIIVKILKIWYYNLKSYKYEVFILINYNNLYYFINTKSLNFK